VCPKTDFEMKLNEVMCPQTDLAMKLNEVMCPQTGLAMTLNGTLFFHRYNLFLSDAEWGVSTEKSCKCFEI
jgi:hypothetical protein